MFRIDISDTIIPSYYFYLYLHNIYHYIILILCNCYANKRRPWNRPNHLLATYPNRKFLQHKIYSHIPQGKWFPNFLWFWQNCGFKLGNLHRIKHWIIPQQRPNSKNSAFLNSDSILKTTKTANRVMDHIVNKGNTVESFNIMWYDVVYYFVSHQSSAAKPQMQLNIEQELYWEIYTG